MSSGLCLFTMSYYLYIFLPVQFTGTFEKFDWKTILSSRDDKQLASGNTNILKPKFSHCGKLILSTKCNGTYYYFLHTIFPFWTVRAVKCIFVFYVVIAKTVSREKDRVDCFVYTEVIIRERQSGDSQLIVDGRCGLWRRNRPRRPLSWDWWVMCMRLRSW